MEKERETLQAWKERVGQELDRVVAFWMEHSHDQEHGYLAASGVLGRVFALPKAPPYSQAPHRFADPGGAGGAGKAPSRLC